MTEITIPSSVTYIDDDCFVNCGNLNEVHFKGEMPANTISSGLNTTCSLYVPGAYVMDYIDALGGKYPNLYAVQDFASFDNIVFIDKGKVAVNFTRTVPLCLNNKNGITSVLFDMTLPTGVTVDGDVTVNTADGRATLASHTVSASVQDDGKVRVQCSSTGQEAFAGESGAILNIPLRAGGSVSAGTYYVKFSNVVMREADGSEHTIDNYVSEIEVDFVGDCDGDGCLDVADVVALANNILGNTTTNFVESAADVNGDSSIDVADIVALVNLLLNQQNEVSMKMKARRTAVAAASETDALTVTPFVMPEGGGSKTVTLDLRNSEEDFTAFQCDLYLPDGVTLDKNRKGTAYNISFNRDAERTDTSCHTLSSALQEDGAVRMICYSLNSDAFAGFEGALVDLPLTSTADVENGFHGFSIKNIVLTRTDGTKVCPSDYTGTMVVGDGGSMAAVSLYGSFTAESLGEISSAVADNTGILSIDMTGAESVENGSSIATGNPNTDIFVPEGVTLGNSCNVIAGGVCVNLVIADGFAFATPQEFTATKAEYTRTMPSADNGNSTSWGTIALPFEVCSDESVQYYTLSGVDEGCTRMTFSPVEKVEAGVPAVFCLAGDDGTLTASTADASVVTSARKTDTEAYGWSMAGTFGGVSLDPTAQEYADTRVYYIAGDSFWYANMTFAVDAFRGWFETPGSATGNAARYAICVWGDDADGIRRTEAAGQGDSKVFNLSGARLSAPAKGKINIINNKKVLVR